MKTTLKFTASKIAAAEKANNENFFNVLSNLSTSPSMQALLFLWHAGGGTDESFDEVFENDGGLVGIMGAIVEGLGNGGFLPKEAVGEVEKALEKASQASEALGNTGEKTKN